MSLTKILKLGKELNTNTKTIHDRQPGIRIRIIIWIFSRTWINNGIYTANISKMFLWSIISITDKNGYSWGHRSNHSVSNNIRKIPPWRRLSGQSPNLIISIIYANSSSRKTARLATHGLTSLAISYAGCSHPSASVSQYMAWTSSPGEACSSS